MVTTRRWSLIVVRPAIASVLALGCVGCSQPIDRDEAVSPTKDLRNGDFSLQVEPIVALDRGPVLLRVTYRHTGDGLLTIKASGTGEDAVVDVPARGKRLDRRFSGGGPGARPLLREDEGVQYYRLHQSFDGIAAGTHVVTFHWRVRLADEKATEIAAPKQTVAIEVERISDESVDRFRRAIQREFDREHGEKASVW